MQRMQPWNQPWQQAMGMFQQTVGAMVEATTRMGEMTSEVLKELRERHAERAQLLEDARQERAAHRKQASDDRKALTDLIKRAPWRKRSRSRSHSRVRTPPRAPKKKGDDRTKKRHDNKKKGDDRTKKRHNNKKKERRHDRSHDPQAASSAAARAPSSDYTYEDELDMEAYSALLLRGRTESPDTGYPADHPMICFNDKDVRGGQVKELTCWVKEGVIDEKDLADCPSKHVLVAKIVDHFHPDLAARYPQVHTFMNRPIVVYGFVHSREKRRAQSPDQWLLQCRPINCVGGKYRLGSTLHAPSLCIRAMFQGEVGTWLRRVKQIRLVIDVKVQQKVLVLSHALALAYPTLVGGTVVGHPQPATPDPSNGTMWIWVMLFTIMLAVCIATIMKCMFKKETQVRNNGTQTEVDGQVLYLSYTGRRVHSRPNCGGLSGATHEIVQGSYCHRCF